MPIPKEILAVKRPSSTVVKARGERFVVIKRTSKRKGGRVVPVDLGMVGEIIDGRFVERVIKRKKKAIDIKDYGEVTLCNKMGCDLLQELANVWDIGDAKRLYVMALLRAAFGDVKNGELQLHYATSFASEYYPGVHLSEQAVSSFLVETTYIVVLLQLREVKLAANRTLHWLIKSIFHFLALSICAL